MIELFTASNPVFRVKEAVNAAKPATRAPINPVASMSIAGLSILRKSIETLCASTCALLLLIQKLRADQKRKRAINPHRNAANGFCGMKRITKNAMKAILHQGK